jgi:hypothetical protein
MFIFNSLDLTVSSGSVSKRWVFEDMVKVDAGSNSGGKKVRKTWSEWSFLIS